MFKSQFVISRSGASTLSEITALGKPTILIPYKFAKNNHQEKNAKWLVNKGAGIMLLEEELTVESSLFWRLMCEYYYNAINNSKSSSKRIETMQEILEDIIAPLPALSLLLKTNIEQQNEYIANQLLEIVRFSDLSNEAGRLKISKYLYFLVCVYLLFDKHKLRRLFMKL